MKVYFRRNQPRTQGTLNELMDTERTREADNRKDNQVNEKGHLRLSRRALLPDPAPEKTTVKQQINSTLKENVAPRDDPVKVTSRKPSGKELEKNQEKFVRRPLASAIDDPSTNKERPSKGSAVASKDGANMVNGDSKIR